MRQLKLKFSAPPAEPINLPKCFLWKEREELMEGERTHFLSIDLLWVLSVYCGPEDFIISKTPSSSDQ